MLNLVKADLYRMMHQKSFYITLGIELVLYFLILNADGFSSNTPYAMFDHHVDSIVDFLYFLPKSMVFVTGLMLYGAILICETYSSKCASTIYPVYTKKVQIVLAQWITYVMIYMFMMMIMILMILMSSLCIPNEFGELSILDYVVYIIVQGCFYAAMMSIVGVVCHSIRNTTITVIFAICLGASLIFMICVGLMTLLHVDMELLSNTLYVSSGTLPYTFTLDGYMKPVIICFIFTLVAQMFSIICLKKRDLN